jgi:hypothetical protein
MNELKLNRIIVIFSIFGLLLTYTSFTYAITWPLPRVAVTLNYGDWHDADFHDGIDIPGDPGDVVVAVEKGILKIIGKEVVLESITGRNYIYRHVPLSTVTPGSVEEGMIVGRIDASGAVRGFPAHLHLIVTQGPALDQNGNLITSNIINPLSILIPSDPGNQAPTISSIQFVKDYYCDGPCTGYNWEERTDSYVSTAPDGTPLVSGKVDIIVNAYDLMDANFQPGINRIFYRILNSAGAGIGQYGGWSFNGSLPVLNDEIGLGVVYYPALTRWAQQKI